MKRIVIVFSALLAAAASYAQVQRTETLLKEWEFRQDHNVDATDGWKAVSVPHDWAIYGPFDRANDLQTVAVPGITSGNDIEW